MDRWEQEGLRTANRGIRNQVEDVLDAYEEQRALLPEVQAKLAAARASATSADGLVEVTVDTAGVLTEVRFEPKALRSNREQLGRSVTEAGREAARRAQEQARAILAPIAAAADGMPDLPDLVPGSPSLREPPGQAG
ncbi:YbaB/EbfC family nucleoid-associated protein [Nocardia sp. CA2R105]|uniref:YbaB/EbfC family nucleoid-associated protein n=1 Tax=Nocardia coffeae TaxID=2873381 RepID=UPI001CA6DF95|nr:YbaB/EbfC family nucleoid-associated protein [Nocardia coffeae]MBY8862746.1 YbaB/EbfC family nucleoid-associated protein [Nocardia coffeae]